MSLIESVERSLTKYKDLVKGRFEEKFIDHLEIEKSPPKEVITNPKIQTLFYFTGQPYMTNLNASVHGGSSATALNLAGDIVATAVDKTNRTNLFTIESQVSYHRPLEIGTKYGIIVEVEKVSGRFFSARTTILDSKGVVMLTGRTLKTFHEQQKL